MFIKSLRIGFAGLFLCVASAWAGPGSIQGTVKDAKGRPIKGADVRVESRDGKQLFNTVKTDGKGHYISQGLKPGVYRVSLTVNEVSGAVFTINLIPTTLEVTNWGGRQRGDSVNMEVDLIARYVARLLGQ